MRIIRMMLWALFAQSIVCAPMYAEKTLQQAKSERTAFPVARRDDLKLRLTVQVDLAKASATGQCTIQNLSDRSQQFSLRSDLFAKKLQSVEITSKGSSTFGVVAPVAITSLGPHTKVATLRPYLLLESAEGEVQLLFADQKLRLEVLMPAGARLIKATPTLARSLKAKGVLSWNVERTKMLPPLRVWYTTAPENIRVSKTVSWKDAEASVRVKISNQGGDTVAGLRLRTQFPATLYSPVPDKSEGEFIEQSHDMFLWNLELDKLAPGDTRAVIFTVARIGPGPSVIDSELLVYNKAGDLLAAQ